MFKEHSSNFEILKEFFLQKIFTNHQIFSNNLVKLRRQLLILLLIFVSSSFSPFISLSLEFKFFNIDSSDPYLIYESFLRSW